MKNIELILTTHFHNRKTGLPSDRCGRWLTSQLDIDLPLVFSWGSCTLMWTLAIGLRYKELLELNEIMSAVSSLQSDVTGLFDMVMEKYD